MKVWTVLAWTAAVAWQEGLPRYTSEISWSIQEQFWWICELQDRERSKVNWRDCLRWPYILIGALKLEVLLTRTKDTSLEIYLFRSISLITFILKSSLFLVGLSLTIRLSVYFIIVYAFIHKFVFVRMYYDWGSPTLNKAPPSSCVPWNIRIWMSIPHSGSFYFTSCKLQITIKHKK